MRQRSDGGFTLLELLIVVAIIGVLVAVAVPLLTNNLERSRESTDLANVRSAAARVVSAAMVGGGEDVKSEAAGSYYVDVALEQSVADWQSELPSSLAGVSSDNTTQWIGAPRAGGTCRVKCLDEVLYLYWNGATLAAIDGVEQQMGQFWTQNDDHTLLYLGDSEKNSVSPVALKAGDSFIVPESCLIADASNGGHKQGIVAFYLAQNTASQNQYKPILDSGWLDYKDMNDGFTPAAGNTYFNVTNPDDYYTAEKVDGGIKFTVNTDGLSLFINNRNNGQMNTVMNQVYVEQK